MILRRYYPKGFTGKTYSEEYLKELEDKGVPVDLIDTARVELLLDKAEQTVFFDQSCKMVLTNTRWVLDNLDSLVEYKVNWQSYKKRKVYKQSSTNSVSEK